MCRLTPARTTRELIRAYESIYWASEGMKKRCRNMMRARWQELAEAFGREETTDLVFVFLLAESNDEAAERNMYEVINIVDSREE